MQSAIDLLEQQQYFNIDRKLGSNFAHEIHEALDELPCLLNTLTRLSLVNSLLVRLTELVAGPYSPFLKQRAAKQLFQNQSLLLKVPSKDQIGAWMSRQIKNGDEAGRIICLKTTQDSLGVWGRDLGLYHSLLGKLAPTCPVSLIERKEALLSLSRLLVSDSQVGKAFARSIIQLSEVYLTPLHVLIYLLRFPTIDSHRQKVLLNQLLGLYQGQNRPSRRSLDQLYALVLKFASQNYRILQYYYGSDLKRLLPSLGGSLASIKETRYPFLISQQSQPSQLSTQELIDDLSQKKKTGKLKNVYSSYQDILYSIIDEGLLEMPRLLLLYFIEDQAFHYDRNIRRQLTNGQLKPTRALFKQLAVVGCFESALLVLQSLQVPQLNYILLRAYLQFKAQKEPRNIEQLRQVASIIDDDLFKLVQAWELMENIQSLSLASHWEEVKQRQSELSKLQESLKNKPWLGVSQVMSVFKAMGVKQSPLVLKERCYSLLPSSIMSTSSFWFAHLPKEILTFMLSKEL